MKQIFAKKTPFDTAAPVERGGGHLLAGHLESVHVSLLDRQAVALGWVALSQGATAWIQDEAGRSTALDDAAFFFERKDITDAVSERGLEGAPRAFLVRLPTANPEGRFSLRARSERGEHVLVDGVTPTALPLDPKAAFRALAQIYSPTSLLAERAAKIDLPVIGPLVERQRASGATPAALNVVCGALPESPRVSVIIPMYGRFDLLEPQLLKFSQDPWMREHAELIYVVDDPELVDTMRTSAPGLAGLYGQGFRWLWGGRNRGFSGANNLGVAHARADRLLFLNSDVFPRHAGWLPALLEVLEAHPDVQAVGPRLLFADGSLQHAGMRFAHREDLGIWINLHPWRGLSPELDPAVGLTEVPAVTGACLAMRRADFDRVGGWDDGYLIGDFEDSDLCMSLRAQGGRIAYLPELSLTHLERQSLRSLGDGGLRTRIVIYNAVRHQSRWGEALAQAPAAAPLVSQPAQRGGVQ